LRSCEQSAGARQLSSAAGPSAAAAGNFRHAIADGAGAITQPRSGSVGDLCVVLHRSSQHPYFGAKQGAVGWIVNGGLHDRRVGSQRSAADDLILMRSRHHASVDLGNHTLAGVNGSLISSSIWMAAETD